MTRCPHCGGAMPAPPAASHHSRWTAALDARLGELWTEGHPARDIAVELETTRSAVIGRANRLGLPAHPGRPVRPLPPEPVPDTTGCRFPHGDPGKPGFGFCGAKRVPGRPYCAFHMAVAYRKPTGTGEGMILNALGAGGRR